MKRVGLIDSTLPSLTGTRLRYSYHFARVVVPAMACRRRYSLHWQQDNISIDGRVTTST